MNSSNSNAADRNSPIGATTWGWRWWIWLIAFLVWTVGLVVPSPGEAVRGFSGVSITHKFLVAKTTHVVAYCLLTMLAGWQQCALRYRRFLLVILLIHGPVTELIQRFASNRSGRFLDVGLDYLGIVIGLVLTWRFWVNRDGT